MSTPAEFVYQPVKVGAREGDIAVLEIGKSLRDYTFRRPLQRRASGEITKSRLRGQDSGSSVNIERHSTNPAVHRGPDDVIVRLSYRPLGGS